MTRKGKEREERPVDLKGRSLAVEKLFVGGRELLAQRPITETKVRQVSQALLDDVLPAVEQRLADSVADVDQAVRADLEALRAALSTDLHAFGDRAQELGATLDRLEGRLADLADVEAGIARLEDRATGLADTAQASLERIQGLEEAGQEQAADLASLAETEDELGVRMAGLATWASETVDGRLDALELGGARTRAELTERADGLVDRTDALEADLRRLRADTTLEDRLVATEMVAAGRHADISERADGLDERVDGLESWAGRAEGRLATLEDVTASLNASLEAHAKAATARADAHGERVRDQLREQEDAMADLRREVAAHEPTFKLIRQELADLEVASSTFAMSAIYRPTPEGTLHLRPGQSAVLQWDQPVLRHDSITVSRGRIRVAKAGHYHIGISVTLLAPNEGTIGSLSVLVDGAVVETFPLHRLRANPHRVHLGASVHATPTSVITVQLENELDADSDASRAIDLLGTSSTGLLEIRSVRLDRH